MHLDPKARAAAIEAANEIAIDGAPVPDYVDAILRAYLSTSLPADAAELVERLQEFAKATVLPIETENGERLDHTDSLPWLAASLIQSQAARIAELEAGMKPFADRYDAWGDTAEGVYTYEDYTPRMVSDFARARALLNRRAEG